MDSGHITSHQLSVFDESANDGLAGSAFFFSCLQHREVLATLRYGIEARKGLILCTGEAGTGKSMLLKKLEREIGSDIGCLLISDPFLSFAEIVRRLLRSLHADSEDDDQLASLSRCQQLLRSQLAAGRINAVAFDDAQHLRSDLLEQIRRNLIVAGASDREHNLAQVLLMGRPEMKERLLQPPLRLVGSQIECQLQPLEEQEVVDYVRQRLRAAALPEALFEPDALGRVASYSGGNFRQADALCDRALRTAQSSSRKQISLEIVEGVANDLDLVQPRWVSKDNSKRPGLASRQPSASVSQLSQDAAGSPQQHINVSHQDQSEPGRFHPADDSSTQLVGKPFLDYSDVDVSQRLGAEGKNRLFLGSKYMVEYVRHRLRATDSSEELFEPTALERIAGYSGGKFRQANTLCDRALRAAQDSSAKRISSEIVDAAAQDLDLKPPQWGREEHAKRRMAPPASPNAQTAPRERIMPQEHYEPFRSQFATADFTGGVGKTFLDHSVTTYDSPRLGGRGGSGIFIGSLIVLSLIATAGVSFHSDVAKQAVGALGDKFEEIVGTGKQPTPAAKTTPPLPFELSKERGAPAPLPTPEYPSGVPEYPQDIPTPLTKAEEPVLPPASSAPKTLLPNPPAEAKRVAPPAARVKGPIEPPAKARSDLAAEVSRAILNRAVEGVRVTMSDSVVYLDGRVATERQRRAAEIAANDVPGVGAVRNRIAVE